MRDYEGLVIIDAGKEGSLKEVVRGITDIIVKQKGKIEKEESWGKQRLPYPIKKNSEGIYYKLDFSIDPSEIKGLKNSYKLNPDILRIMITAKAK